MSQETTNLKQIKNLDVNQLAEALELNGYAECVEKIRTKQIDGETFLKLTEPQISLWRLPSSQGRRLWSFIQQVQQNPKKFLMNAQTTNKMTPKGNMLNKPSMNDPLYSNVPQISRFSSKKSNVAVKSNISNQFQKSVQKSDPVYSNVPQISRFSSQKPNVAVKSNISNQFKKLVQKSETKEPKSSTLTKQESNLFKNKLEQLLKNDSNENQNSSFIYNQKQPGLPPQFDHFRPTDHKIEESPYNLNYGYLCPVKMGPPKAIVREKPFPSTALGAKQNCAPNNEFETDDKESAKYIPVLDNEKSNEREERKVNKRGSKFDRPLPAVPSAQVNKSNQFFEVHQWNNDQYNEELAEYATVNEEYETDNSGKLQQNSEHRVLSLLHISAPPTQLTSVNQSSRTHNLQTMSLQRPKAKSKSSINMFRSLVASTKLSQPHAELSSSPATLPRSSANLPKPPSQLPMSLMDLPSMDNFLMNPPDDLPDIGKHVNLVDDKPLPVPPSMKFNEPPFYSKSDVTKEDSYRKTNKKGTKGDKPSMNKVNEPPFYSKSDLAKEYSYRKTDKRGAKRMLKGLEDGAFVIRPSKRRQYICTFSITYSNKIFNLRIQQNSEGALEFVDATPDFNQPKFYTVGEIIAYYTKQALHLFGESIILKDVLPRTRQ